MRIFTFFAFVITIILGIVFAINNKDIEKQNIVVTIKPIYGLVAAIAKGVTKVTLLMDEGASPHIYELTPKQISMIANTELLITVGPSYEQPLQKYLPRVKGKLVVIEKTTSLKILQNRFTHGYAGHSHSEIDGHLWLDLDNAILICNEILKNLNQLFPNHAKELHNNTQQLIKKINGLKYTIKNQMAKLGNKNYAIYHDCLQYFDATFNTNAIDVLVDEPGMPIKSEIFLKKYKSNINLQYQPVCLFVEPQFYTPMMQSIAHKLNIKLFTIDYLGTNITLDENAYINIMLNLANQIFIGLSNQK